MRLHDYCGRTEFSILQFTFHVTKDITKKIEEKKLRHKEEIVQYIHNRMDHFFKMFNFKQAVLQTYKNEVFNSVIFKLKQSDFSLKG